MVKLELQTGGSFILVNPAYIIRAEIINPGSSQYIRIYMPNGSSLDQFDLIYESEEQLGDILKNII